MKAVINALTLALLESQLADMLVVDAKSFAEQFVRENAELFVSPTPALRLPPPFQWPEGSGQSAEDAPVERVTVHRVPVVGADGLTEKQRVAVGSVGLCGNCQQPNNSHLPGCARASGEDKRAFTKDPLSPAV